MNTPKPLVVDMDGTLLRTDSLQEAIAANLRHPGTLLRAGRALLTGGKPAFKRALAGSGHVDLRRAPFNERVLALAEERASLGGSVVLATGADRDLADQVASRVPTVSLVLASDGSENLTGAKKARALVARFGEKGFDYVGDARVDLGVWQVAGHAYLASTRRRGIPRWARDVSFSEVLRDPSPPRATVWLRAARVHQTLKNVLLFLPLIAAHQFTDVATVLSALAGFVAFTLMAISVYFLNDAMDIAADRAHPRKRSRPMAAGWLPPLAGIAASGLFAVAAIVLGALLNVGFLLVLLAYAALTLAYSFRLKRIALVDVVVLALLYMVRIVAGAVATGIPLSFWFTGVALFLFLSLALVKRYAEAHQLRGESGSIPGRGYSGDDIHAILALGSGAGVAATLLSAIYIQSDTVREIYEAPAVLWLVVPVLFYWVSNLWLKAGRGLMHDDPLIFALRDRASLLAGLVVVVIFVVASLPVTATLLADFPVLS